MTAKQVDFTQPEMHDAFPLRSHYDVVIVGSGHNGLIAAAYLSRAGLSVLVLERANYLGGATASQRVFPEFDAWLSRYAYLVSLLPTKITDDLKLNFTTRRSATASFTPYINQGGEQRGLVFSNTDHEQSRASLAEMTGSNSAWLAYQELIALEQAIAKIAWPSLLAPLRSRQDFISKLDNPLKRDAWESLVEQPLGITIEKYAAHDVLRGLLLTDAKIGVFTHAHDQSLLQNRCFLYHVIGNETGEWQVPVGGMRRLVESLVERGLQSHVQYRVNSSVTRIVPNAKFHCVAFRAGDREHYVDATRVLVNAGPRTFKRLLGLEWQSAANDEGSVVKINMLLRRLPRLKATGISAEVGFGGSLHIDEGYAQMQASFESAAAGQLPVPPPAEVYCHTLTDPSILSSELQAAGYHTLTLFGLDMPYRLFRDAAPSQREELLQHYLAGLNRICDEPVVDCLAVDSQGEPCIEMKTPVDLEFELDLDLGNIFHNQLSWFFTDDSTQVGQWGVETAFERIYRCGSSAERGGAVSGIPGHNTAMKIFAELS